MVATSGFVEEYIKTAAQVVQMFSPIGRAALSDGYWTFNVFETHRRLNKSSNVERLNGKHASQEVI